MGNERGPCQAWPVLTRLSADGSGMIYAKVLEARSPTGGYAVAVDADGSAYLAGDDRAWAFSEPDGWLEKFDAQGTRTGSRNLNGHVASLTIGGDGDLVVVGDAWPGRFPITPGAPTACLGLVHETISRSSYIAKLKRSTLEISYAGYLPSVTAHLAAPDAIVAQRPYSTLRPFAVVPAGPPPAGTVTCIANAADYGPDRVAPGEVISIFGNRIGPEHPANLQFDSTGKVATQLAGISVTADGLPAPILFADPGQVNLVLPFGIRTPDLPQSLGSVRIALRRDGALIASFDKPLYSTHPAAFSADRSGVGLLAALNQDGSVNSPANPAAPGEVISIFATGLGAETPQPADGDHPPMPATQPVAEASGYVNGVPARIEYIGNAPTLVHGVVQINVRLPAPNPPTGVGQAGSTAYVGVGLGPSSGPTFGGFIAVR